MRAVINCLIKFLLFLIFLFEARPNGMRISFPATRGAMGGRTYYACMVQLSLLPTLFTFRDWSLLRAEDREQRSLNKKRIPEIARYLSTNPGGYLFSSITASYKGAVNFEPGEENKDCGVLEVELEAGAFVINDGQHRCAAITEALKENPRLGEDSISVLLFPYESLERVQQMFSDLNRYAAKTSKSLDVLYDKRDPLAGITLAASDKVSAFRGLVEKDATSLGVRSSKLFGLSALYDANEELLKGRSLVEPSDCQEAERTAIEFWTQTAAVMSDWTAVRSGKAKAWQVRAEKLSAHGVVLRALGAVGAELLLLGTESRIAKLRLLGTLDWGKSHPQWENVCVVANSVVSNRQARLATRAFLKQQLGLPMNEGETRAAGRFASIHAQ
jgi:DNA sulfur modification protein DndB